MDKLMCVTVEIPVQHSVVVGFALAPLILVVVAKQHLDMTDLTTRLSY